MEIINTSYYHVTETTIFHEIHGTIILKEHYENGRIFDSYLCDKDGDRLDEYNEIEEVKKLLSEVQNLVNGEKE